MELRPLLRRRRHRQGRVEGRRHLLEFLKGAGQQLSARRRPRRLEHPARAAATAAAAVVDVSLFRAQRLGGSFAVVRGAGYPRLRRALLARKHLHAGAVSQKTSRHKVNLP